MAALILVVGLFSWYQYIHKSTYGVFWDTVDNNLNLFGVTRTIDQSSGESKFNQKLQISLGAENVARGLTTITQPGQNGTIEVVTETLGTLTNNYARYVDVSLVRDNAAVPDISSIKNVWGREDLVGDKDPNQSVLAEGLLFSSFPLAGLSAPQRQEVIQFMKDSQAYEVDYKGARVVTRAGKQAYEYNVIVNMEGYIAAVKMVDEMMGLNQLSDVDPTAYAEADPAQLTVVNSIDGRQLLEVSYTGTTRTEKYSAYGARITVDIPETNLLRSELEQRVQTIFGPQT